MKTLESAARGLLIALLALAFGGCGGSGDSAPATAKLLQQDSGEWLVINYWAVWCRPCIKEIPELNEFMRHHADRARVLAVNFDGVSGEELRQQAAQLGFEVPQLESDPADRFGYSRPEVLPTTVVVDPSGSVKEVLIGPQTLATLASAVGIETSDTGKGEP